LDVGCATGERLTLWRDLGWEVHGVEPNRYAAGIAAEKIPGTIRASTLEQAGFDESRFDCVTMEGVLEHVPSPRETLGEVDRVLKPGGQLVIRVPNARAWETILFRGMSAAADMPRHWWIFHRENLARLLRECGFEIESITTFSHLYTLAYGLDAILHLTPRRPVNESPQPRWVLTIRRFLHLGARCLIPFQRLAGIMNRGSELTVSAVKRA
jgi:SAM-dependent methyltransferase